MKTRFSLSMKFALLALLNVVLLAVVFVVFVRWQLSEELESFLMSTARDRISSVSRSLALDMQQHDRSQWTNLLTRYSEQHGVTFSLIRNDGQYLAGPQLTLPPNVHERLIRPPQRGFPGFPLFRERKDSSTQTPQAPPAPNHEQERELKQAAEEARYAPTRQSLNEHEKPLCRVLFEIEEALR